MTNLPTLIFVPGAWHQATCYNKITELLKEKHKLKCISITLPSTTGNPAATFKDDLDAAREAISGETSHGRDVVVIAHSYGGIVGNSAIKEFTRPRDAVKTGRPSTTGHVIGLILIASGFNLTGLAFMDPFFGHSPPIWRVNAATGYVELVASPRELFYHDLPTDEADYWVSQLTSQSLKALFEGGEFVYAGWRDVPAWYIGAAEDQAMPVAAQRMTVGMARAMGGTVEHRELPSSHSPFLSRPEETAGLVWEAVEAFTGNPVGNAPTRNGQRDEITVPEARLWKPTTWYKFGLPLIFGHMLGKCVLIFYWGRRLWRWR